MRRLFLSLALSFFFSNSFANLAANHPSTSSRATGRAERDLAALPISDSTFSSLAPYSFRPAGIVPVAPIPEASYLYRNPILSGLVRAVGFVAPSLVISTPELAKGLIEVALKGGSGSIGGWPGKGAVGNEGVFENEEIKRLAKGQAAV